MTLGAVGHHVSVFHIDGVNAKKVPHIVNTCLAVIHCHFASRDKFFIREEICNLFSLEQIKAAREVLFTTNSDGDKKYSYRGPSAKSTTERDKLYDAFEGIFNKMTKLDADNTMPSFSVPSNELQILMMMKKPQEHTTCDCEAKFKRVDNEMKELRDTFKQVIDVVTSTNAVPGLDNKLLPKSANSGIPPAMRRRLISTTSKRSASEFSADETEDGQLSDEDVFIQPKSARKKARRYSNQKVSVSGNGGVLQPSNVKSSGPSYSNIAQRKPKPPATKGTVKSTAALRGAVSDIFLFNCDVACTKDDVLEHFNLYDIKIRNIEKKSHELSARSSIKLSPQTKADYDKILSEECLPEEVCARQYIHRRGRINTDRRDHFQRDYSRNGQSQSAQELSRVANNLLKELDENFPTNTETMDTSRIDETQQQQNGSE